MSEQSRAMKSLNSRREQLAGLRNQFTGQPEGCSELASLVGLQAKRRMNGFAKNPLGCLRRHRFDIHASFGAGDHHRRTARAIEKNGEVKFASDVHGFGNEHLVHDLAARTGLMSDKRLTKHLRGKAASLIRGRAKMNSAF
jgi:hypothetical protein